MSGDLLVGATVANGAELFAARPSDADRLRPWLGVPSRQLDAAKLSVAPVDGSSRSAEDRAKSTLRPADGFAAPP